MNNMNSGLRLTDIETDALGELVNISMGAGAKVLSTMLNLNVMITTPQVTEIDSKEFVYKSMFPAVGVKIEYIEGLTGFNFFVMKQKDIRTIVDIMMGTQSDDNDSEFSELYISAISEVMNQMMGASSTALASFFDKKVNISTPECVIVEENTDTNDALALNGRIVVIKLQLKIGDIIDSEFVNVMPLEFAKAFAVNLLNIKLTNSPTEKPEKEKAKSAAPAKETKVEKVFEHSLTSDFSKSVNRGAPEKSNLNIIMDVPLEVIVQIGKTNKPVKEIIEFTQGSIIELEKQAGDPVDIIVNGELIAKGDVVVIDDNFGVRITEILNN